MPQDAAASRIELGNLVRDAFTELQDSGIPKRTIEELMENLEDVIGASDFWHFHANSLVVLAAPGYIRTYRLANDLTTQVKVSDRFHVKPLLRALTFPHNAYILALTENEARVVEFFADASPEIVEIPNMPTDALSAIGRSSNASSGSLTSESGSRGPKMRLTQYARKVDAARRPLLMHHNSPLILVSTVLLASIYRSVASVPNLLKETVFPSTDRINVPELVALARPVLDAYRADRLLEVKQLFEERAGQKRVATDLAQIAKAATNGMVSFLLVDFDKDVSGFLDESGNLTFSEDRGAYSLTDEIVKRSLACGAEVMAVRKEDMIENSGAAAILRYPF